MLYVEKMFQGLITLDCPQKSDREVLQSVKAAIIRDQKYPIETGISSALADAVRLINYLYDENQKLAEKVSNK